MPASLATDELALRDLPVDDLVWLLVAGGGCSKRRENMLIRYAGVGRLPCLSNISTRLGSEARRSRRLGPKFTGLSVQVRFVDAMAQGDDEMMQRFQKAKDARCKGDTRDNDRRWERI
jgi:hypothetical protein